MKYCTAFGFGSPELRQAQSPKGRLVARKMPVGGSALDTDALNLHPFHIGGPEKNFEILSTKSCIFVHTSTVLLTRNRSAELYIIHLQA